MWIAAAAIAPASARWLFFLPGTFAPAIVALALTARSDSRFGLAQIGNALLRWHVPARWYVFAVVYMLGAKLAAGALHRIIIGEWPAFGPTPIYLMLAAIFLSTPIQAGEEIGWRGYALPRMASRWGYPVSGVLLGVIWALWHLPLFFLENTGSTDQPFIVYLLPVTAISVAMTWLYVKTEGSLLMMMLMHAAINNTTGIIPASERYPSGAFSTNASPMAWLTVGALWAGALYFLARMSSPQSRPDYSSANGGY